MTSGLDGYNEARPSHHCRGVLFPGMVHAIPLEDDARLDGRRGDHGPRLLVPLPFLDVFCSAVSKCLHAVPLSMLSTFLVETPKRRARARLSCLDE